MKNNFLIYDENEVLLYRLSNEDMWLTVDFDLYDSNDILVGNITNGFYLFKTSFQISIKGKKTFDLLQKFPYTGIRYYFDNLNWKIIRHDIYSYTIVDNETALFKINYIKARFDRCIECDVYDESLYKEAICITIAIKLFNR